MLRESCGASVFLSIVLFVFIATPVFGVEQSRGGPVYKPVIDEIHVGLKNYKLLAFSNNKLVFEYPIAIGVDTGPTPTGKFTVTSRLKNPWHTPDDEPATEPGPNNPLGTRWIGISKPSYGLHGTKEPSSIGTKASEGCIRLSNRDVEELYRHVTKQTRVIIRSKLLHNPDKLVTLAHQPEQSQKEG
ncbi:MAG: L,D-transpeptidase [bacterium]